MYHTQLKTFFGQRIVRYHPDSGVNPKVPIYRIDCDWNIERSIEEVVHLFVDEHDLFETEVLIFGAYQTEKIFPDGRAKGAIDTLIQAKHKFPKLRALFFGDCSYEESMIEGLYQDGDFGLLLEAFPGLEYLRVWGSFFNFSPCRHVGIESLIFQTNQLEPALISALLNSILPNLTNLELWLGEPYWNQNAINKVDVLLPLLENNPFPNLKHLGLMNSPIADEVAMAISNANILVQLESLNLSGGILTDKGGQVLIQSSKINALEELHLHHHFMSDEMTLQFIESELEVDVSRPDHFDLDDENYRYIAVGE